ncbi:MULTISPECIES: helix-turn-helix transcriptional regulator [Trichocoleus]|uniref:Helix-turn-helix domain-containing protein n=1 Tax=Trichocoleus desertorum GB2-A4 TaxID=2933944 RepID=A0ABV0JF75_9CYAN|nr:helix-turn-helix domain-containing protein [Trichocoleus sp. FACHB-46]MBD1862353.1 helix-turn-helix domain-containing protein [Trichocoleus sp. FACHB-46]
MINLRLAELREKAGKTQKEMADLLGFKSINGYQNLEYGNTKGIQFDHLDALCNTLSCTPGDLIEYRRGRKKV